MASRNKTLSRPMLRALALLAQGRPLRYVSVPGLPPSAYIEPERGGTEVVYLNTLGALQNRGLVEMAEQHDGTRLYEISERGRALLDELGMLPPH